MVAHGCAAVVDGHLRLYIVTGKLEFSNNLKIDPPGKNENTEAQAQRFIPFYLGLSQIIAVMSIDRRTEFPRISKVYNRGPSGISNCEWDYRATHIKQNY